MISIPISDTSYASNEVSISGERFIITYRYNTRAGRWYIDISNSDQVLIYAGLKLLEGTSPELHLENIFSEGFLSVFKIQEDELPASRDNLGIGKSYELIYTTFEEFADLVQ